eukprot:14837-Heterococcus_DN1.PRE.3
MLHVNSLHLTAAATAAATAFVTVFATAQIGFVEGATGKALVLGEYGGSDIGTDAIMQKALADYLHTNCISDSFL